MQITCVDDMTICEVLTVSTQSYRLGDVTFRGHRFTDVSAEAKVGGERFLYGDGRSENKRTIGGWRERGNFRKCSEMQVEHG